MRGVANASVQGEKEGEAQEFLLADRIPGLALSKATCKWVQHNVFEIVPWRRCNTCNATGPS